MSTLKIRPLLLEDCQKIVTAFEEQGWQKPLALYHQYMAMQSAKERDILVATIDNSFAGYLTINWKANYPDFKAKSIPEIADLNVLKKFQKRGIATDLIKSAEIKISKKSKTVGIGVGLTHDYGQAQRLYIRLGYMPDGKGVIKDNKKLNYGDQVTLGDDPILYLTKTL